MRPSASSVRAVLVPVLASAVVAAPFVVGLSVASAARPARDPVFAFADPRITEASALIVRDGLYLTANDSGDVGRVFAVDGEGRTVGVTTYDDAVETDASAPDPDGAVDVEALAPLPDGDVLVGDLGDNAAVRPTIRLSEVRVGRADRSVTPSAVYRLRYPDGPQDAETLMVQPDTGRVLIVGKGFLGGRVYEAPARLRTDVVNVLRPIGTALGVATDGAFFPDGRHFVVRDYSRAVVYSYPGVRPVASFDLPAQEQGEGIGVAADGEVYVTSEGVHAQVLRVDLPERVRRIAEPAPAPTAPGGGADTGGAYDSTLTLQFDRPDHDSRWPWVAGGVGGLLVVAAASGVGWRLWRRRRHDRAPG